MDEQAKGIKKRKWLKWTIYIASAIIAVLLIAVIGLNLFLSYSKPTIKGEVTLSILEADVKVVRDEVGVPHITAESEADLYRAQGYVQAQDRLFQMDLSRRQASGRLAEVVGEAAVPTDKFFRTFSLRHAAEKSWDNYDAEAKQILEWFAEGVNTFIDEVKGTNKLSFEFKLLGYEPEQWTPIDSLTIGKYMAYDLGGNWNLQAFRHWALQNYSEQEVEELIFSYPDEARSIIEANIKNPVQVAGAFDPSLLPNEFNGSNNWVVAGSKTESGEPLLADDPHLGLSSPSVWYQMHLTSPEQNVSGVIFAGIPGIILGHNDSIAWGVTNVNPDVQDLYIETVNPNNPYQFEYDGEWYDAEVRDEPIKVKGQDPVDFEVITTKHGPVISEVIMGDEPATAVFSMQWTALEPTRELQAVIGFNKSTNWEEFETALEDFNAPAQNFVFADKEGNIAYKANGNVPIRKVGTAALPVPGNSSEYGWIGYIPYDELPRVVNPAEGFIATANNEVVGDEYPYHLSNIWAQPYRYERIAEVLEASDTLTVQDMKDLQMDPTNLYARQYLPSLLTTLEKTVGDSYKEALTILKEWDYKDEANQAAPLIFNPLMEQLQKDLFEDEMPEDVFKMMPGKGQILDEMLTKAYKGETVLWIEKQGGLEEFVTAAFEQVMQTMTDKFGKKVSKWQWGDYHQLTFNHPIGGANKALGWLLNAKKVPVDGSSITVMAADFNVDGHVTHGASWRFVADLSDLQKANHIVGPGQSGHVKSEWYGNQIEDWANGTYHETKIDGNAKGDTLLLKAKK